MSGLHIHQARNFHIVRWGIAILVVSVITVYAYFGFRWYSTGELSPLPLPVSAADASIDETPVTDKQRQEYTVAASQPRYIEIPKLGITNVRVVKVGLTERTMLDVPKNLDDTGWYAKSALPGSGVGAVLIDGHNSGVTRNGVFAKLHMLVKGDQVSIERGDGKVFTYEIQDTRQMKIHQVNKTGMKDMMYSPDPSKEGLSLVASSGKWIPKDKVFDHRILVRATVVE